MMNNGLSAELVKELNEAHSLLLAMHKALMEHERGRYEAVHGKVPSAGAMLNLLLNEPFFAWLRVLSGAISEIDECLFAKKPTGEAVARGVLDKVRVLLASPEGNEGFFREYSRALEESAEVAEAHAHWRAWARGGGRG